MTNDDIYTVERVAELLGLSDKLIRQLAANGELVGYKQNGRWFFLHSDIVSYIKSGEKNTPKN